MIMKILPIFTDMGMKMAIDYAHVNVGRSG